MPFSTYVNKKHKDRAQIYPDQSPAVKKLILVPEHKEEVMKKGKLRDEIIESKDKKYTEPLETSTWRKVLIHFKNKDMFRHINKAGQDFADAMFDYMADFIFNKLVPDTYDYTKLFGLWKQKGSKLDL